MVDVQKVSEIRGVIKKMEESQDILNGLIFVDPVVGEQSPLSAARDYAFYKEVDVDSDDPILDDLSHPTVRMEAEGLCWNVETRSIERPASGMRIRMWGTEFLNRLSRPLITPQRCDYIKVEGPIPE